MGIPPSCRAFIGLACLLACGSAEAARFADHYCQPSLADAVAATRDGGCIGVGIADRGGSWSGLFVKVDASGGPLWATAVDAASSQEAFSVAEVADGYIAAGIHEGFPLRDPNGVI